MLIEELQDEQVVALQSHVSDSAGSEAPGLVLPTSTSSRKRASHDGV